MNYHNRRRSRGLLMPNLFFFFQLVIIGLVVHIFTEIISLGPPFTYFVAAGVLAVVLYCMDKRSKVIQRQGNCQTS